ncbi:diguanylate cyclase (GGDEF) domain-containing protein [Selenomonas sp. WCT3]|uniref:sensor domain-containing diguanylate cyclase n=1 Tax=Selenomonas sp. WCT3 TaxID=3158785 RepID=UPI0008823AD5|nr:diguanylate cyclase (GGDEF) domain-containing protein [Selenomonas ruminantium]
MSTTKCQIPTTFGEEVFSALENFDRRIYFRWDLRTDKLELKQPVANHSYDIGTGLLDASTKLWHSGLIHPDDLHIFRYFLHKIYHSSSRYLGRTCNQACKIRIRSHKKTDYLWSEIHIITYFDDHQPVIAFGNLRNIQAQKLWQQRIEQEASFDKLTGLLNKETSRHRISEYLDSLANEAEQAGLLLIDADGFKGINDSFGHLFGDAVLADMGSAINHNFRQSDIKGRIGGDEFIVLFRNLNDLQILHNRCQVLIQKLQRQYQNGTQTLPFSISVGVSLYPEHGTDYAELFKHADRALYEAKSKGKNQYVIYHNSLFNQAASAKSRVPNDFEDLQQKAFKDNMIEFIFKLLYETNSPDATISLSLSMFGKRFNLDRVALDLFDPDVNQYTTAYEWLSPNGVSLKSAAHNTSLFSQIAQRNDLILNRYKATSYGVMSICEDTTKAASSYQPALTALHLGAFAHCMITHGSDTLGCIGFESRQPRPFDDECLHALSIFAVILGNILLTSYSDDKLRQQNSHLRDLLDHMQEMVYVVDKITLMPLYFNQAIRQTLSESSAGHPCYELFHQRMTPCPDCPVQKLSGEGSEYIACDLSNWDKERPTTTRACNLHWNQNENDPPLALVIQEPF